MPSILIHILVHVFSIVIVLIVINHHSYCGNALHMHFDTNIDVKMSTVIRDSQHPGNLTGNGKRSSKAQSGSFSSVMVRTAVCHYNYVIMSVMAFQITGVPIVCSTVCSRAEQRKHQSSAPLAFVRGIHLWPVNCPHKGPVTRKIFPFKDVIVWILSLVLAPNSMLV